jgi:hypothetical protein
VFTRNANHWTQDKKLVGTKSVASVALAADGGIIVVGEPNDNGGVGTARVFTRSGGRWTQDKLAQDKLVGSGAVGKSTPAVVPSAEGSMAGESNHNGSLNEASIPTRSGGGSYHQGPATAPTSSHPVSNLEE